MKFRRSHYEPTLLLLVLGAIVVVEQRRAGAYHPEVAVDVAVAGWSRGEGGPAGAGLATHAARPAAHAAERDRSDDQRQLQSQLLAAGDVQVDLRGWGYRLSLHHSILLILLLIL